MAEGLLLASFIVMDLHGLSRSSGRFLCFLPNKISIWKAEVRCRSISLTRPFLAVAQNSECWLCVWSLGEFLVVNWHTLSLNWHILSLIWHILILNWHILSLFWRASSLFGLVVVCACIGIFGHL